MKIFFDTEFTGLHKDTTLISLGCVAEDGKTFYAEFTDYDGTQCNNWIRENVIQHLIVSKDGIDRWVHYASEQLKSTEACVRTNGYCTIMRGNRDLIAVELRDWLKQFDSVQFISDVCHYDFVLLIDLFGTAFDCRRTCRPVVMTLIRIFPGIIVFLKEKPLISPERKLLRSCVLVRFQALSTMRCMTQE